MEEKEACISYLKRQMEAVQVYMIIIIAGPGVTVIETHAGVCVQDQLHVLKIGYLFDYPWHLFLQAELRKAQTLSEVGKFSSDSSQVISYSIH